MILKNITQNCSKNFGKLFFQLNFNEKYFFIAFLKKSKKDEMSCNKGIQKSRNAHPCGGRGKMLNFKIFFGKFFIFQLNRQKLESGVLGNFYRGIWKKKCFQAFHATIFSGVGDSESVDHQGQQKFFYQLDEPVCFFQKKY